jgi:hypothetical protein
LRTSFDDATVVGTRFGRLPDGRWFHHLRLAVWRTLVQPETLEKRVERLEALPARIDALEVQISEFRAEVRAEFSATRKELRQEMTTMAAGLRQEIATMGAELRQEMTTMGAELRQQTAAMGTELRGEMATAAEMRLLHEDVIERIKLLGERPGRTRVSAPRRPKR